MPSYKKDNKWYCSFYYTDWKGSRKKKKKEGFATKREAQAYEREFIDKMNNTPTILFENLYHNYMKDCEHRLKPTTLETKKICFQTHILPYFGEIPINEITPTMVREWENEKIKSNLAKSSLSAMYGQLSAIFNFAVKYYGLPQNPAKISGNMGNTQQKKVLFWTFEEYKQFMLGVENERHHTIFELLFYSGMRVGELLALTPNDFDFENKTVKISKNYATVNGKGIIQTPKTPTSNRTVTLPTFVMANVKAFIDKQYMEAHERVFELTRYAIVDAMKRNCTKTGVKYITVHGLRHSTASLLINHNFSPLLISQRLGHKDVTTTLRIYSHLYPNKQEEVTAFLESLE